MTVFGPIKGGVADLANRELKDLRRRIKEWCDDTSKRSGSPLGHCLFVACRDTLASGTDDLRVLRQAANAVAEYERLNGRG